MPNLSIHAIGWFSPQLFEQARDGVADVVWTLPGYSAGRFPSVEVFEMPFMMQSPEATSKAVWDYVEQYAKPEFKDVKALAFHVHGDGVFHMVNKPIRTAADLKGVKLRAPTRATNKFIAMLGATPVSMPVPQVGDGFVQRCDRRCRGALRSGACCEDSRVGQVPL